MSKIKPQRPSADATRDKILKVATQLFMQHGFSGTSMGKLAEKADINQSLIFHHFGSKQELWHKVKAEIVASTGAYPINPQPQNLKDFLSEVIHQTVSLYNHNPALSRLISWQRLESSPNKENLSGIPNSIITPIKWIDAIQFLQGKNLLQPQLNPKFVVIWLVSSIDGMLTDSLGIFKNNVDNQKGYIDMLVNCFEKALSPALAHK